MTFEEWYQQEGYLMTGSGCSHEVVARAAFFVVSQRNSDEIESLRARVAELESSPTMAAVRKTIESKVAEENTRLYQRIAELEAERESIKAALTEAYYCVALPISYSVGELVSGYKDRNNTAATYMQQLNETENQLAAKDQRIAELEALCSENNGIIQRMGIGIKDKDRLIAQLVRDAEMYGPNKLAIEKQAWVMADSVREIRELRDQLAAQALTIKTLKIDKDLLIEAWNFGQFSDDFNVPQAKPVRAALRRLCEALALPDNSTEVLQEWLDKQLGEPVGKFNWATGKFTWLTKFNFSQHHNQPLYRKPEIK